MIIAVKTNLGDVSKRLSEKITALKSKDVTRPIATEVLDMMTERIHEEGKAADGSQIGTYNNRYLKLRKKKYNRTGDKKIIVSLTRRLENDWGVISTERGWGIGFLNKQKGKKGEPVSQDKMKYVEEQKGKKIARLTEQEKQFATELINDAVSEILK